MMKDDELLMKEIDELLVNLTLTFFIHLSPFYYNHAYISHYDENDKKLQKNYKFWNYLMYK